MPGKTKEAKGSLEKDVKVPKYPKLRKVLSFFRVLFVSLFFSLLTFGVILLLIAAGTYLKYADEFLSASPRNNTTKNVFYDKNGEVIYQSFGAAEPKEVALIDIPDVIKDSTLASEDAHFYNHGAIDLSGLVRAAYLNYQNSNKEGLSRLSDLFTAESYEYGGGSTITQQLVKNLYLTNERSFERKTKEIVYSFELERKYSKDEIFEMYLNNVYYGEQSLGIANAAENYFSKNIDKLTLAEATMLAGLPQAPSRYSPISGDFEAAKERQKYVLSQMYYAGMITLDEAEEAAKETLCLSKPKGDVVLKYPYFVNFVKDEVKDLIGPEAFSLGGLEVYTSLDPKAQRVVEIAASEQVEKIKYRDVSNAASIVLNNTTGKIVAMMGGLDYNKSKVNVATSKRQPGSSFKPIVYTAGILEKYSAATILWDSRVNFGGTPPYIPRNYDGGYRGYVTVRRALANSLNVPAVEMTQLVGVDKVLETADTLGIDIDRDRYYGLSLGLGSAEVTLLDMAEAYSTLANLGKRPSSTGIIRIVDSTGDDIYLSPSYSQEVLDPKVAYIMTSILSDNRARREVFGSNSDLQLEDRPVAAKTGTTDSYTDAWTMGFTPQYTVGVWVGNNDHSKMRYVPGLEGAAPIWNEIMNDIHAGLKKENFKKPKGLSEVWINPYTGKEATYHGGSNILEYFIPGTEPKDNPDTSYLNVFR
ncbi:MAG: PBP1A family penicillin-binding protein [Patescibacteria group bacterium]|nr:PBP1A family penicillin-binding protein [Patescibacteria group bacterium]